MSGGSDGSGLLKLWILCSAVVLILSAPVCGLFLARSLRKGDESRHWPSVEGKVLRAGIAEVKRVRKPRYRAVVEYRYKVNGVSYTGRRLQTTEWEADKPWRLYEALSGIVPGKKARVYYRPDRPAESVLKPGSERQEYLLVAVPFVLLALGLGALLLLFLSGRRG